MTSQISETRRGTLLGIIAILLWSTTIAFSRSLTEQLGTLTASTLIYGIAGLAGMLYTAFCPGGLSGITRLPRRYLLVCGGLFVLYIVALYLAVGLAVNRVQVLIIGLINYLWPGLSLVFSIPILHQRARPLLPAGILLALAGIGVATLSGGQATWAALTGANVQSASSLFPYALAMIAAISWGLYSTLSRRWAAANDGGAVPLFLIASGLLLGLFRLFSPETSHWSLSTGLELAYMALFPALLAYGLWDIAVRKGDIILVASLSYLTPLLSTVFSSLVLNIQPGLALWLGAGLVIAGAVICKVSIIEEG